MALEPEWQLARVGFPLAVLGSLGIIGTPLFALFFVTMFAQREPAGLDALDSAFRKAAKYACFAS
jgi:hypothetical protein